MIDYKNTPKQKLSKILPLTIGYKIKYEVCKNKINPRLITTKQSLGLFDAIVLSDAKRIYEN